MYRFPLLKPALRSIVNLCRRLSIWKMKGNSVADRRSKIVVITGCDSGLGFAMARRALGDGLTVVAGFLKGKDGGAAEKLSSEIEDRSALHCLALDITKDKSVEDAVKYVDDLLRSDDNLYFHAVINNAGVMTFAEFEWLTSEIINKHIDVNFKGTINITQRFMSHLRKTAKNRKESAPRIITVTSHCALQPLPKLSVYCATKAALSAWTEALRIETSKYGVHVVNFIPGSFFLSSNISALQKIQAIEMKTAMTQEQNEAYGLYFDNTMNFITGITKETKPDALTDEALIEKFSSAVLDGSPRRVYKHEPWRYTLYHFLFRIPCPGKWKDILTLKFMAFPSEK